MTTTEKAFHEETTRLARELVRQLVEVDPAIALAAAVKAVATLAIRKGTRVGNLVLAVEQGYLARRHELDERVRQAKLEARESAQVIPFRRAV